MSYVLCIGVYRAFSGSMGVDMSIYQENGFSSRREYLENLADDMGIDPSIVYAIADLLGHTEDFDGLVTSLEDYAEGY
jgi:hypothetical protein